MVVDLKRLKNHYANYEPMLKMMRGKYETAMKASPPPPAALPTLLRLPYAPVPLPRAATLNILHSAFRRRCSSSWSATAWSHG